MKSARRRRRLLFGLVLVGGVSCCSIAAASSGGVAVKRNAVASKSAAPVFARTLRKGDSGADVKTLQAWLADVGFKLPATGYYGTATKSAVRSFQLSHQLYPASGSVGNRTSAALRTAVLKATKAHRMVAANATPAAGVDPIPGFAIERDDMGVDASAPTGAGIYAPLASTLVQTLSDWYAGEPILLFRFVKTPAGALSNYWYVAEQIVPLTMSTGTHFQQGQRVASFAASGTGIEIGWGSPSSNSLTLAGLTDPAAANPPAGSTTVWGESFKKMFGIR